MNGGEIKSGQLTSGIENKVIVEFRANISVAIFEPQLIVALRVILVEHNHFGTTLRTACFDVQNFAVHRALYVEISHLGTATTCKP